MVGTTMCDAATRAVLPASMTVYLVERYLDGVTQADGRVQGIRFDIIAGMPSFQIGVLPQEKGDITIEITMAAARRLNSLTSADPAYRQAIADSLGTGEMVVDGDLRRLGPWLEEVHDIIVKRTA
ncbi:hypothetical protein [Rhizobium oryzicola]|uniref:Alkyl sulfatase C-terminal domain-containing protein n=1 Tax=Rhizobium oryzicola TaxID=1232668 RepID=A0ABT8T0I8_9HYPH|nr:hypothetical protein [Rhizobium oryzicola]MDO1583773.1 hypothetical protein [Rhizobium oryzicola]